MAYKCSQCGHTAEVAGNCPTCNVPLVEEEKEESASETQGPEKAE